MTIKLNYFLDNLQMFSSPADIVKIIKLLKKLRFIKEEVIFKTTVVLMFMLV